MTRYVIVGSGVAGVTAAQTIRKNDPKGTIDLFTDEHVPFYFRPGLIEVLAGKKTLNDIMVHPKEWYAKNGMALHLGEHVTGVESSKKTIATDGGRPVPYDRLLLADGGHSFVPPPYVTDLAGVFTIRDSRDVERITEYSRSAKVAVVIGGGLLGLETANALRERGLMVTVVESSPYLLNRQLDSEGGALLKGILEGMGLKFVLGAEGSGVAGEGGRVTGISLKDGRTVPADMVVISAGIRCRHNIARSAGCKLDRGVEVDDRMATSISDIWAAGDSIMMGGKLWGIWPASMEQGRVAGSQMSGVDVRYKGTVPQTTLKVAGIALTSIGNIDSDGKLASAIARGPGMYRKVVLDGGKAVGAILLCTTAGAQQLKRAIEQGANVSAHVPKMGDPEFDFKPLSG